jgi:BASS family bile acid:Na+ symporter
MDLADSIQTVLKLSVVLTVIGIGLGTRPADAMALLRRPAMLARSVACMNLVMPIVALSLWFGFGLSTPIGVALVALSVSPVPPLLPRRASKVRGAGTFTVALMVAVAVVALVLLPLAALVLEELRGLHAGATLATVARLVLCSILAPLSAGMLIRYGARSFAAAAARPLAIVANGLLCVSALALVVMMWPAIASLVGDGSILAIALFVSLGLVAGHTLGGPVEDERTALAMATANRHPAIALTLGSAKLGDTRTLVAAILLYLLTSAVVTTAYVVLRRRGFAPAKGHARRAARS